MGHRLRVREGGSALATGEGKEARLLLVQVHTELRLEQPLLLARHGDMLPGHGFNRLCSNGVQQSLVPACEYQWADQTILQQQTEGPM